MEEKNKNIFLLRLLLAEKIQDRLFKVDRNPVKCLRNDRSSPAALVTPNTAETAASPKGAGLFGNHKKGIADL